MKKFSLSSCKRTSNMCDCPQTLALPLDSPTITLCSSELYKKFADSIVTIAAVPQFAVTVVVPTGLTGPTGVTGATGAYVPFPVLPVQTTGFFLEKEGFIVGS